MKWVVHLCSVFSLKLNVQVREAKMDFSIFVNDSTVMRCSPIVEGICACFSDFARSLYCCANQSNFLFRTLESCASQTNMCSSYSNAELHFKYSRQTRKEKVNALKKRDSILYLRWSPHSTLAP